MMIIIDIIIVNLLLILILIINTGRRISALAKRFSSPSLSCNHCRAHPSPHQGDDGGNRHGDDDGDFDDFNKNEDHDSSLNLHKGDDEWMNEHGGDEF